MTAVEKPTRTERRAVSPAVGVAAALILIGVAFAVPPLFGWHVNALGRAPLSARWDPRVGRGTVPAVALALAAVRWAPSLALSLRWSRLLPAAFAASLLWATCVAMVDGTGGIGGILGNSGEYLQTAHRVHDVPALLHGFVARVPLTSHGNWPTHVAGHPPGALLFFVLLVQLGLGSGLAAGWTVVVIASTTAPAVLITLRRLGAEQQARHAVQPSAPGFLRTYPAGAAAPSASILNHQAAALANALTLAIRSGCAPGLTISSSASATVVIDITGCYAPQIDAYVYSNGGPDARSRLPPIDDSHPRGSVDQLRALNHSER